MCIMSYYKTNIEADYYKLLNGAYSNDDGHGYWIEGVGVEKIGRVSDTMVVEFIKKFIALREEAGNPQAVFHSRYATSGNLNKPDMSHPFTIPDSLGGGLLFHNGVVGAGKGSKSDTYLYVNSKLRRFYSEKKQTLLLNQVALDIGVHNKFIIVQNNNVDIVNEKSGLWDSGVWWSNDGYRPRYYYPETKLSNNYYGHEQFAVEQFIEDDLDWWNSNGDFPVSVCMDCGSLDELEWTESDSVAYSINAGNMVINTVCEYCQYKNDVKNWR